MTPISSLKCDFCHAPGPEWNLPAASFAVVGGVSVGDWAACGPCKDLVMSGDRAGLRDRTVTCLPRLTSRDLAQARLMVIQLHARFFKHWSGNVLPLGGHTMDANAGKILIRRA